MNAPDPRPRRRWPAVLAAVLALGAAVAALAKPVARWFETPPTYASAVAEIAAGRLDRAEAALTAYLDRHPDHRDANLVLSRVLLDRAGPKPEEALKRLARVRGQDPRLRAAVLTLRGKALYMLNRFAEAEPCWDEALKLHPTVAEAGWLLLQLYYLEGRSDESRGLALTLAPAETDPVDRVRYVLELVREDLERLSAAGVIQWLEPVVAKNPRDRRASLALGVALAKEGRTEEGLARLRALVDETPDDARAWEAYLNGLGNAGEVDALAKELARVPHAVAAKPALAVLRGRVAQERGDVASAVKAYEEALAAYPNEARVLYRLGRAYRLAKRPDDAKRVEAAEQTLSETEKQLQAAYRQAAESKTFGLVPDVPLYQRFADLLERAGRLDEALAWHRQVVRDEPGNLVSERAVARLSTAR